MNINNYANFQFSNLFLILIAGLFFTLIGVSIRMKYEELEDLEKEKEIQKQIKTLKNKVEKCQLQHKSEKAQRIQDQINEIETVGVVNNKKIKKDCIKKTIGNILFYGGSFIFSCAACFWVVDFWDSYIIAVLIPVIYLFFIRKDIRLTFGIKEKYTNLFIGLYSVIILMAGY